MTKFILTSPTGHLGSRVLSSILEHNLIPKSDLIITTSRPGTSSLPLSVKNANIEIRTNVDFTKPPENIISGLQGGDVFFLSSYPSPSIERWLYHKNAIDAAVLAGVSTIIYTSLMFGGETGMQSVAGVQQAHVKTIQYLEEVRERCRKENKHFDFIVVREGIYAESWWLYGGYQDQQLTRKGLERQAREGNGEWEWVVPNDGNIAWVGWDDLGEGTARIIARWKEFRGQMLKLTGPKTLSIRGMADVVESETGIKVGLRFVGQEAAQKHHTAIHSAGEEGDWVIASWVGWYEGLADGECAVVDPLLERLIGRKPKGIEELKGKLFRIAD